MFFLQIPLWKGSSMGGEIVVVVFVAKRSTVAVEVLLRAKNLLPSSGMDVSVAISSVWWCRLVGGPID